MRTKIRHPLADQISIVENEWVSCIPGESSEIAFFWRGQWVNDSIEPFTEYHDKTDGDTSVYTFVPNELIEAFLDENKA